jgi:hypothetical protein
MLSALVDWGIKAMMVTLNIDKAMQALFAVSPILGIALIAGLIAATAAIGTPPKMAAGGMFDRPTNVTVGEAGPEVILPVTRLSNGKMGVQTDGMGAGASSGGSHSSSGSGTSPSSTGDLHVSVMLDSRPILHTIARASRTGKLVIHPKSVRVEPINT